MFLGVDERRRKQQWDSFFHRSFVIVCYKNWKIISEERKFYSNRLYLLIKSNTHHNIFVYIQTTELKYMPIGTWLIQKGWRSQSGFRHCASASLSWLALATHHWPRQSGKSPRGPGRWSFILDARTHARLIPWLDFMPTYHVTECNVKKNASCKCEDEMCPFNLA